MVKNNAVLATVVFALVVSISSVSYTFYQLYETNRAKHIDNIFTKHSLISQIYHTFITKQISQPIFEANLAFYELEEITGASEYEKIIRHGKVLKSDGNGDEVMEQYSLSDTSFAVHPPQQIITSMIEHQGHVYFWVESSRHNVLLMDRVLEPYRPVNLMSAYVTLMSVLIISFALIIYRLRPLRRLRKQIARFGEGDMGVRFYIDGSDEIALIANELDSTQNKIRSLIESRTLFLRNIMHELKTPIAKGRIVATMLGDEKQRGRFEGIFERLESLIGEFALIEEITSGNQHHEKSEYRLIDIIDGAIDMAMVEYDTVEHSVDASIKVDVDYRLFVTALKNLIDNAIKYSHEKKMSIWIEEGEIIFANVGEPLKNSLSYYIEPFTKEHPTKDSFGLGLYIVDAILKEHDYVLAYERREETNCFICVPVKTKRK
ncbi:MAG: HAMP domain-containing histidine kinase [Sulfuricurvum sp.]|uniref:ArsS family sensor histidine kinase n=1 Tax=Sulfuricurvum sp. TaxID=2025608 RepID=UPI0025CF7108|nr:ArsS family sensor histidine kinase [Sulfuricurvum sp.]MBV5320545.1 HAMP domain-containing histidine kinase [Sulfuricurvum sp.]